MRHHIPTEYIYRSTTTSHRYISFSGIPSSNVMKPDASSYWNSTSVLSTAILLGLTDEYAPNSPQPHTFIHTAPVASASYFTSVMAPPELNILTRPMGANADPDDIFLIGTTVKTSYSFAFNFLQENVAEKHTLAIRIDNHVAIPITVTDSWLFVVDEVCFLNSAPPGSLAVKRANDSINMV
nr:hypothetical protein Iba_scaffold1240411CG0010 [Ipomoea batatas]GME05787.1 hypothetical protein Iba_scaffold3334CG0030 [Ipomoea batatas]